MKRSLSILLLTCCALFSFAQSVIKGTVSDERGDPLPGVTITLMGTQVRTITNSDGKFSINVAGGTAGKKLEFKYLGYTPQEIDISGKTVVDVKLALKSTDLSQVVITALNISRDKKSIGNSEQSVNVEEMTAARANNITDLLDGKVAGLQLNTSGQSTGSTRVVIREGGSISGNNQPLWVVDGVPIDNTDSNGQVGNIDYGNNAAELNPNDIESITVLKGPNAAALYGSKAANGAILVTTKKGSKNAGLGISYNFNYMNTQVTQFAPIQEEYGEGGSGLLNMVQSDPTKAFPYPYGSAPYIVGSGGRSWGVPMLGQPYLQANGVLSTYSPQPGAAQGLFLVGHAATHNIAISNASDNSAFRFSYTRLDNTDVMQKQNVIAKNNFQVTASHDFSPKLKIETRVQYIQQTVTNRTARNEDNSNPMNFFNNAVTSIPLSALIPWKDAAGNEYNVGGPSADNPYWVINEDQNQDILNTIIGGITVTYKLNKDFSIRGQESANLIWGNRFNFIQKGSLSNLPGSYSEFQQNNRVWDSQGLLMFNKAISSFSFTANLGAETRNTNYYNTTASTAALFVHDVKSINNNASVITSSEAYSKSEINSIFGTASAGYKGFLYVDITGRNDWSSTLPLQNASFFYPSVSGSFVFTELWKGIPTNILSFGKIRASIARVGNDTNPYNLYNTFGTGGGSGVFNGTSFLAFDQTLKNANLKPEQTTSTEFGTELRFLNSRLSIDATVYKSSTINQILTGNAPQASGFQKEIINAGEIQNKGIELTVSGTPISTKNFSWNATWNFSANRNLVVSLNPGVTSFQLGGAVTGGSYADVGHPMGSIRGEDQQYSSDGIPIINPANGQAYYTSTKAGALSYPPILGNASPRALTSFGSTFKYKALSLNFLVNAHIGGSLYSGTAFRYLTSGASTATMGGRDEWLFSNGVLGETGNEVTNGHTTLYNLPYPGANRVKGILNVGYYPVLGTNGQPIVDANGNMVADMSKPNNYYLTPQTYWQQVAGHIDHLFVYDDSYVKLSQVIVTYTVPKSLLSRTIIRAASFSLVGRNVWTIFQKTPQGIDPESSAFSGNAQGLEQGGSLPYASYGFDFKISL